MPLRPPAEPLDRLDRLPSVVVRPRPGGVAAEGALRVHVARHFGERRRGLAGLARVPAGRALLLPRCRAVHTLGMRVALDLVWLGGDGGVLRVDRGVGPGRLRRCRAATGVLECAAGSADGFVAVAPWRGYTAWR